MGRRIALALFLCVVLAAFSGCTPKESFPTVTQQQVGYNTPAPDTQQEGDTQGTPDGYNPEDEEEQGEPVEDADIPSQTASVEDYGYAGATPIKLDPIDMPTPTPRPALTFIFTTYEAVKLGLKFDAPAGWLVDDSAADVYTLTEPPEQQKDNYSAFIIIKKTSVSKQYDDSDLTQEVKDMLTTIGSTNYVKWEPTYTADRSLMAHDGVYADYSGTLVDGTRVRGRVHVTCIDKTLYSIHMSQPANYSSDYMKIHGKIRETMALTK